MPTNGGKRPGAGRPRAINPAVSAVRITAESRALLDALALVSGRSQADVIGQALTLLDAEWRKPVPRRKGPRAVVA